MRKTTRCEEMGCTKLKHNKNGSVKCLVLTSFTAWWQDGTCTAFTTDKGWAKKVKIATKVYKDIHGGDVYEKQVRKVAL